MFQPVKDAFGRYLVRFFSGLSPTTKPLREFVTRAPKSAIQYAPSRMVDQANEMFIKYLRADVKKNLPDVPCERCKPATTAHLMPVILVALSQDVTPTPREYTRQVTEKVPFTFPDDPKQRVFRVQTIANDIRAQVVFFAEDEPTARSMAAQFLLFLDEFPNRRFYAEYEFAGFKWRGACQVDNPEVFTPSMDTGTKNLVVLASDVTLRCTVPIFFAPKKDEPNDGKGQAGSMKNPAGYPVVLETSIRDNGAEIANVSAES